jgi:hypothetical protein
MTMRTSTFLALGILLAGSACTVNQTEIPPLSGPSDFATSLTVTASPDIVIANGQQSTVVVEAHNAAGGPLANQRVHLDALAGGSSGCGRLSLTEVTTGNDGRAAVAFTAPTWPLPQPECAGLNSNPRITIFATPLGTNFQTGKSFSASILVLAPSSTSTPSSFAVSFSVSPNPGTVGANIAFADTGSVSPGHTITSYRWDWSDGASKTGASVTHDFPSKGSFTATLTITDDIGQSGFKTALVTIN